VTTNLKRRLKSFTGASAEPIQVVATFPGHRDLEQRLHRLFSGSRITNEFLRDDFQIQALIDEAKRTSIIAATEQMERQQHAHKLTAAGLRRLCEASYQKMLARRIAERDALAAHRRRVVS